ncbi:hypothetical protein AND_002702 [Anopheles darlingi]|uniref:Uncharacterized protein n=1 Tax=Anopheles darlingi TaxID=43151 RepID=W5JRH4_ANODA|nr:hypothetical protein AND_002702 [Anopheles darlingi]
MQGWGVFVQTKQTIKPASMTTTSHHPQSNLTEGAQCRVILCETGPGTRDDPADNDDDDDHDDVNDGGALVVPQMVAFDRRDFKMEQGQQTTLSGDPLVVGDALTSGRCNMLLCFFFRCRSELLIQFYNSPVPEVTIAGARTCHRRRI